ncbi:MAG: hypothetical protein IIT99_02880, partial [Bacteroidales bacterium]|nr:hypothetical protein [Bacteroidales bacterium]
MSVRADRTLSFLTVTLFFVALWAIFQFVFPYHLAFKERYVLFLSDASWLATYFTKAAPFSFLFGDWLTQFFRLPGVAALVTALLLVLAWAGFRFLLNAMPIVRHAALWALLPTALLAFLILSPEVP